MSIIALFAVVLVSLSAHSGRVFEAAEGYKAPGLELEYHGKSLNLDDMKGRFVLVNFWSSLDAMSRISASDYDSFVGKADKEQQLSLISVNLDPSEALFREIIRRDGLSESSQWHVEGPQAGRISDAYNLRHGLSSFLHHCCQPRQRATQGCSGSRLIWKKLFHDSDIGRFLQRCRCRGYVCNTLKYTCLTFIKKIFPLDFWSL